MLATDRTATDDSQRVAWRGHGAWSGKRARRGMEQKGIEGRGAGEGHGGAWSGRRACRGMEQKGIEGH